MSVEYISESNHTLYILGIDSSLHGYKFIFETLLDTEKYKNLIEGDFAIDDVVFSPGCL